MYFSNFLAAYNQSDLFKDFELPLKYALWMDIYAYHLEHPQESQWRVSLAFGVSKGTVWNAYRFMEKGRPPTILWSLMSKKKQ